MKNEWRSNNSRRSNNRNNISSTNDNNNRDNIRKDIIAPKGDNEENNMTLLGCMAIIIAGVLLNSDYNNVLLKILGTILIIVVTKIFEGECR